MITIIIIIFIIIFNIAVIQKKRMYVVIYKLACVAWHGVALRCMVLALGFISIMGECLQR